MPRKLPLGFVVAAGFAAASLLAACGGSVSVGSSQVSQHDVESTVASQLAASTEQPTPTISCPGGLDAKVGASIDCTLTPQGGGSTLPVHVSVDSVDNGTAHFTAQVGQVAGGGNKTQFCQDNATLDAVTSKAEQPSDLLPIFQSNASTISDFLAQAPQDIIADASTLANTAKSAVSSGDASAFTSAAVMTAGQNVDRYCGQSSDGSPVSEASTVTTTAP